MDKLTPPPKKQKAVTPKFLRFLHLNGSNRLQPCPIDHAIDLLIGGFFFATRPCEIVLTKQPGKTKTLRLRDIVLRDNHRTVLLHSNPDLLHLVEFVSVTWREQKNEIRMDTRTQRKTNDPVLCPTRLARAIQRVLATVPNAGPETLLCAYYDEPLKQPSFLTDTFTLQLLRNTCRTFGGKTTFGFDPNDIGNRSIRSGAAMALFLRDCSVHKIMILGRWSSDAFLAYIRPQVLEWTNNMSRDMISFDSFLDIGLWDVPAQQSPRTRRRSKPLNGRSSHLTMPAFHLD